MAQPNIPCTCGILVNAVMPNIIADDKGNLWHVDDDGQHPVIDKPHDQHIEHDTAPDSEPPTATSRSAIVTYDDPLEDWPIYRAGILLKSAARALHEHATNTPHNSESAAQGAAYADWLYRHCTQAYGSFASPEAMQHSPSFPGPLRPSGSIELFEVIALFTMAYQIVRPANLESDLPTNDSITAILATILIHLTLWVKNAYQHTEDVPNGS